VKQPLKKVTVLIPCYNEAESITGVVTGFPVQQMKAHGYALKVVVINNNSSDQTAAVARAAGAQVIHETRQGKGHAIRTGFHRVTKDTDYVVMLDGDFTYNPAEIIRLLEPINSGFCNVVIGSRLGGRITSGSMTTFNRLGNWIFSHLVRYLYRVNVTDVLTGYFAWDRHAIERLRPHLTSQGFAIEMEMITKMAKLGEEIYSVPISYHSRSGSSSLRPIRDGARILAMYLRNFFWRPASTVERVAFVSDTIYPYNMGGKETRLAEITKRLVKPGREVHIYTMKWWDGPKTIIEDGIHLHAISRLHPLYRHSRRSFREALMFGFATFKLLFQKFDTLDVDSMPFFPLYSARIVCWLRGKKLYATWHEVTDRTAWTTYIGTIPGTIAWAVERLATALPDLIISNSQHTTRRLRQNGTRPQIITIPLGVDLEAIYSIQPSVSTSDVIFVGRLLPHKNVDLLVHAMAKVQKTNPEILCRIIGNGPESPRLEALIHKLGLAENVRISPFVPLHSELYGLMKASKVFVLPSIREGFSLVVVEANANGIPVVTTNHPDNAGRELIIEGVNGYLTDLSPDSIAQKILLALDQQTTLHPTQNIEQYDWNTVAKSIEKVFAH